MGNKRNPFRIPWVTSVNQNVFSFLSRPQCSQLLVWLCFLRGTRCVSGVLNSSFVSFSSISPLAWLWLHRGGRFFRLQFDSLLNLIIEILGIVYLLRHLINKKEWANVSIKYMSTFLLYIWRCLEKLCSPFHQTSKQETKQWSNIKQDLYT